MASHTGDSVSMMPVVPSDLNVPPQSLVDQTTPSSPDFKSVPNTPTSTEDAPPPPTTMPTNTGTNTVTIATKVCVGFSARYFCV